MALEIAQICTSIAGLDVAGVTIADLDQIPEQVTSRKPMIFPRPDGFVSNFIMERNSFGGGSTAKMTVTYTLNYRLCYAPIGEGRGVFDIYPNMVEKAFLFLDAVLAIDTLTGLEDITPGDVIDFGPVTDPAGNLFHGCDILINIMEFVN